MNEALDSFYDELEELEADFAWWQNHVEDLELLDKVIDNSSSLLNRAGTCLGIDRKEQGRICFTAYRINEKALALFSKADMFKKIMKKTLEKV